MTDVLHRWPRVMWATRKRWRRPVICIAAEQPKAGLHLNRYIPQGLIIGVWLVVPWSRRYLSWVWPVWIEVGADRRLRWFAADTEGSE